MHDLIGIGCLLCAFSALICENIFQLHGSELKNAEDCEHRNASYLLLEIFLSLTLDAANAAEPKEGTRPASLAQEHTAPGKQDSLVFGPTGSFFSLENAE